MKSILTILKVITLLVMVSAPEAAERVEQTVRNGSILETRDAFPYTTYEEWLNHVSDKWKWDEASVRSQYPPEKFQEFKDTLPIKVNSYEEFLSLMKRHFEEMQKGMQKERPEIEAKMRSACPPELFREFKENVVCQSITYASEGLKIQGFILTPRPIPSRRLPVVIYNHGGNARVALIDDIKLMQLTWLVRAGYTVVASQYRGCGESEGSDEMGGSDVADVLNLIPMIESLPYADTTRIGMFGWSRGGMMTFLALSQSTRIAAAVIGGAPTNLFAELKRRPEMESLLQMSVPDYAANKETALKDRSAQFWPEKLCPTTPILLMQGANDQSCVPRSALEMALALEQTEQPFRLIFFESGSHGLQEHSEEVNQQTLLWFKTYLGKE